MAGFSPCPCSWLLAEVGTTGTPSELPEEGPVTQTRKLPGDMLPALSPGDEAGQAGKGREAGILEGLPWGSVCVEKGKTPAEEAEEGTVRDLADQAMWLEDSLVHALLIVFKQTEKRMAQ